MDNRPRCPNCGQPVDAIPVRCRVCGYRSDRAAEYFWLYVGGGVIGLVGIATGVAGVILEGTGPSDWSAALAGWFPLGPWPAKWHWLAFVVEGIALTLVGMGITRRRRVAVGVLAALVTWELGWCLAALASSVVPAAAYAVLTWESLLAAFLVRAALAMRRLPSRDAGAIQNAARESRDPAEQPPEAV